MNEIIAVGIAFAFVLVPVALLARLDTPVVDYLERRRSRPSEVKRWYARWARETPWFVIVGIGYMVGWALSGFVR